MFFILSKVLGFLCHPLSISLLCLLLFAALLKRRRRLAWALFGVGVVVLYVCSTPLGADLLLLPLEREFEHPALPPRAEAILVLGGTLDLERSAPGRLEFGPSADRLIYALTLAQRFPRAKVIFSGGTGDLFGSDYKEASLLKAQAIELGLSPDRILVDDRSRNTHGNALEAHQLLDQIGASSVLLVTSAFHMRRSLGCMRKVGVDATPYAVDFRNHWGPGDLHGWVPDSGRLSDASAAVHEYVGLLMYRLQGYL